MRKSGHIPVPERRAVLDQIASEVLSDPDTLRGLRLRVIKMLLVVAVLTRGVIPALRIAFEILRNMGGIQVPEDAPFHCLGEHTGTRMNRRADWRWWAISVVDCGSAVATNSAIEAPIDPV